MFGPLGTDLVSHTQNGQMQNPVRGTIFVLWGNHFDETQAIIFTAELRKVGLQVKIVGLGYQGTPGTYGVTICPDITLEQALRQAEKATCIVVPCSNAILHRLGNDPILYELFQQAHANDAMFVVHRVNITELNRQNLLFPFADKIAICPNGDEVHRFAREVAISLLQSH